MSQDIESAIPLRIGMLLETKSLAHGDCGKGIAQARGLVADSWYRVALCQKQLGALSSAKVSIQKHFSLRGPGCHSIYEIKKVKRELVISNA